MAGRAQQNFKVDVNRTKTQRWVDAKQASYGGDDWGGYDDYDDIQEEDEPPIPAASPPLPKVTGLRQRGQASVRDPSTATARPPSKPTSPELQQHAFARRSSFEAGDDRRDLAAPFTASGSARSSTQNPADVAAANAPKQQQQLPQQQPQQQRRSPVPPQAPFAPPPPLDQHRSAQPPVDSDRQFSPPPPRSADARPLNAYPPLQTDVPPPGGRPDKASPGQSRYYAKGPGSGSTPNSAVDPYQRREFSPGHQPPPLHLRDRPSQEFANGKDSRGPPPPRDSRRDYDPRGPLPPRDPRDYRGPPPPRDPRDYRSPPPRDLRDPRGPPPNDPRYRGGPPHDPRDPRGPPPRRDYAGPPGDHRGPPPPGYRGDPRGPPPHSRPPKDSRSQPPTQFAPSELPAGDVIVAEPQAPLESEPSIDVGSETTVPAMAPAADAAGPTSPPIVRPADIYKRVSEEKERERQSLDSARPSIEGRPSQENRSSTDGTARLKPNLTPVVERRSEYGMDGMPINDPVTAASAAPASQNKLELPLLPSFDRFSGFGVDLGWSGATSSAAADATGESNSAAKAAQSAAHPTTSTVASTVPSTTTTAADADLHHQPSLGFRTAVNDAFEGETASGGLQNFGSMRSQPTSDMSRSNTDSTAGISPIMSRVPSAATAELKANERSGRARQPSLIAEEPSPPSSSRPTSSDTLKAALQPGGQDRVVSGGSASSTSTRHFMSPEPTEGPAHTAAVSSRKRVEHSHEGEISSAVTASPVLNDMSRRESDLADAASARQGASPEIGNEAKDAQSAFISAHKTVPPVVTQQLPQQDPTAAARSASPSKSRVHQLANKYNDIHDKASPTSSLSSWNSSANNSRENLAEPEGSAKKTSLQPLRPQLPGGWVSETSDLSGQTSTAASNAHSEEAPSKTSRAAARDPSSGDPRPTTAKQQLPGQPLSGAENQDAEGQSFEQHAEGAMAQLAASGNSLAKNLAAAMAKRSTPSPNPEDAQEHHERSVSSVSGVSTAEKPLAGQKGHAAKASTASSIAPTPPPKTDSFDRDGAPQRQSGYFPSQGGPPALRVSNPDPAPKSPEQKSAMSEMSVESSGEDAENDRLRKEIMKDLSPPDTAKALTPGAGLGLAPMAEASQATSATTGPHEYSDYWDEAVSKEQTTEAQKPPVPEPIEVRSPVSPPTQKSPNFLQSRFSWEDGTEASVLPPSGVEAASRAPVDPAASSSPRASVEHTTEAMELAADHPMRASIPPIDTSELQRLSHDNKMHELRSVSPTPEYDDEEDDNESVPSHAADIPPRGDSAIPPRLDSVAPPRYDSALANRSEVDMKPSPTSPLTKGPISGLMIPDFKKASSASTSAARTMAYKSSAAETSGMDTGLQDWLSHMLSTRPELNTGGFGGMRPSTAGTGTVKAKHHHQPAVVENFGQASQDLMHVANKLGGKASQSAKGFFAKGRSRFRRGSVEKTE